MAAQTPYVILGDLEPARVNLHICKLFQDLASVKTHVNGWNGWFFLSESTDKHARKFHYNLKERRKERWTKRRKEKHRTWGIKALVLIRPSLWKLTCEIHWNIPTHWPMGKLYKQDSWGIYIYIYVCTGICSSLSWLLAVSQYTHV